MKNTRKLAGLLLALVMVLAMAVPTFAVGELADMEGTLDGGKITISPAVTGQTYELYQILYLESYKVNDTETGAGQYAYKATTDWKTFLRSEAARPYVSVDSSYYVTWKGDPNAKEQIQAFSKLALAYAKENGIKPVKSQKAESNSIVFDSLNLGYYLADTTVGTMCMLNTTNPEFTVNDKNDIPTNSKLVQENGGYVSENDIAIGETINFRSTIDAKRGAQNYVYHDKMDAGLDFIGITSIVKNESSTTTTLTAFDPENTDPDQKWDYKLVLPADDPTAFTDCQCTFHVVFNQDFLDTILAGSNIDIDYTGKLNQNAVVGATGNINKSWLSYGEKGDMTSTPSQTVTKTWEFSIFKFTETSATGEATKSRQALAGATFKICKDNNVNSEGIKFSRVAGSPNTYKMDPNGSETTFTTDENGLIYLQGFDQATYYLFETEAPDGYNKLAEPITVVFKKDGEVFNLETKAPNNQIDVVNNAGSLMPSTGGIGTTIFYVVGGVLLIGAGVLLVVRKRMSATKESR